MSKTVCQNTLPFHSHRNITARFDGGSLTSDAGWLLFGSLDRQHRLCEGFSSCISESRDQTLQFVMCPLYRNPLHDVARDAPLAPIVEPRGARIGMGPPTAVNYQGIYPSLLPG